MRRLFNCTGAFFSLLSLIGYASSLAMPGIGWMLAALSLTMNSLLTPWLGNRHLMLTLVVSAIHLLTLGPFAEVARLADPQPEPGYLFAMVFIIAPFGLAAIAVLMPFWRFAAGRLCSRFRR